MKTQTKDIRMVVPTFSILILPESPGIQEMIFLGHKDNETCIPHQLLCSSGRAAVDVQLPSNLPLPANIILVSVSFRFLSRWEAGPEYDIWDIKEKFGTGKVLEWVVGSESVVVGYGLSLVPVAENLLSEKSLHKILSHSDFLVLK